MGQPNGILVFALGCIGALAPEIVRLYKLRRRPWQKFSSFYILVSVVYAGLGGVVAIVLPAVTTWAAFYAGVTWPTLISTITHHRTVYAVNERRISDNIVRASDKTPTDFLEFKNIKRVRHPMKEVMEFLRDHADGLFE